MKKLFFIFLLFASEAFASGKCHRQRNPIGYANYDVCEVEGTGYTCVSLEGKANSNISCFLTRAEDEQEVEAAQGPKFIDRKPTW